ncbi:hypothetical protein [Miniphocaeibacter massiliensis]|uniref:hypothetical protein n=1 Tax=Miniphocaeibacter massiliensis TaxID=2041841 RepID=UPI000C1C6B40|nr:hypothetical protein [Miniphocaeibacter massiliensis]
MKEKNEKIFYILFFVVFLVVNYFIRDEFWMFVGGFEVVPATAIVYLLFNLIIDSNSSEEKVLITITFLSVFYLFLLSFLYSIGIY